ncbi:MAG TPA: redox-sensing transcriptional repressor Rex [Firmicutes bacterium]|jgi:redox-sensing transcriptional repressor|nr:redox-sensing transcriptional repressor Rex [Bacillota bacterium]
MVSKRAPKSVIRRLPVYLRILDHLIINNVEIISSKELSEETGFSAEQIRKDLAFFGAFGTRGSGYNTDYLRKKILKIIGLDGQTNITVIGAGHLGTALIRYYAQKNPYVNVVAAFDVDSSIVGQKIFDIEIVDISNIKDIVNKYDIKVAVMTVPAEHAQPVAEKVVESGISVIFNFAPVKLRLADNIHVHNVDLSIELQSLIYYANTNR